MRFKLGSLTKLESLDLKRNLKIYQTKYKVATSLNRHKEAASLKNKIAMLSVQELMGASSHEVTTYDAYARAAILKGFLGMPLDRESLNNPEEEFEKLFYAVLNKYPAVNEDALERSGWFSSGNANFANRMVASSEKVISHKFKIPVGSIQRDLLQDAFLDVMFKSKTRGGAPTMTESLDALYSLGSHSNVKIAEDPIGSFAQAAFYMGLKIATRYNDIVKKNRTQSKIVNTLDEVGGADDIYRDDLIDAEGDAVPDASNPLQDLRDMGVKAPGYMHIPAKDKEHQNAYRRHSYLGHLFTYSGKDIWNMYLSEIFINLSGRRSNQISPIMNKIVELSRVKFMDIAETEWDTNRPSTMKDWFNFQGITPQDIAESIGDSWGDFLEKHMQYSGDVDKHGISNWVTKSIYSGSQSAKSLTYHPTDWKSQKIRPVIRPESGKNDAFLAGLPTYAYHQFVDGVAALDLRDDPKGRFQPPMWVDDALEEMRGDSFKKLFMQKTMNIVTLFCGYVERILAAALKTDGWLMKEIEDGLEDGPDSLPGSSGALVEAIWGLKDFMEIESDVGIHGNKAIIRVANKVANLYLKLKR